MHLRPVLGIDRDVRVVPVLGERRVGVIVRVGRVVAELCVLDQQPDDIDPEAIDLDDDDDDGAELDG